MDDKYPDYRWMGPMFTCLCGCNMFAIAATWDRETREPGYYLLDGRCVSCHALALMPTPIDTAPEGGLMIDQPEPAIPVTVDLTCPQCESDENTIVVDDEIGRCMGMGCTDDEFRITSEL